MACCGECKYHVNEDGEWVCDNSDSDNYALETEYSDRCEEFEERED